MKFLIACEHSRFFSLLAARDVLPGETSAPLRQKFHTDDVKSVRNLVRSAYSSSKYSIYSGSSDGPIFGGGNDIRISNHATSNRNSYGNLSNTYSPPSGYSYGRAFAQTFLAGTYNFTPDEVETFYETNKK